MTDAAHMPLDVAALAFAELVTLYGAEFKIEHGEHPNDYWREAIGKLTADELERGLRVLAGDRGDPPNCSQFAAVCRTGRRLSFPRVNERGRPDIAPRAPLATPAIRDATLARIQSRMNAQR